MKKTILSLAVLLLFIGNAFSAGSSGGDTKSNYDKAVKLIKSAKKNEKKGKKDKAKSKYEKALFGTIKIKKQSMINLFFDFIISYYQ